MSSMKTAELTFPVTLEAFAAYQETGIGRELSANEREAIAAWMPIINQAYRDGQENDYAALRDTQGTLARFLAESEGDLTLVRFLKSVRCWTAYAWKRGREEAGT